MLDLEPIVLGDIFVIADEILLIFEILAEKGAVCDFNLFLISLEKV